MATFESRWGHPRERTADGSRQRDRRRGESEERQAKRKLRTPQQQLALLDKKFGKNEGAIKERIRLHSLKSEQPKKKAGPKSKTHLHFPRKKRMKDNV